MPECHRTPCSKQAGNLKFKWSELSGSRFKSSCSHLNFRWDSSMMWHHFERNEQTAEMCVCVCVCGWVGVWNKRNYCSCCIVLIRIDTILSILSRIIFIIFFLRSCPPSWVTKHIFWKFYCLADTLWSPKTVGWVLGYTTAVADYMHRKRVCKDFEIKHLHIMICIQTGYITFGRCFWKL